MKAIVNDQKEGKVQKSGENKDKWKDKNLKSKTKGMRDKKIGTRETEKREESGEEAYEREKKGLGVAKSIMFYEKVGGSVESHNKCGGFWGRMNWNGKEKEDVITRISKWKEIFAGEVGRGEGKKSRRNDE